MFTVHGATGGTVAICLGRLVYPIHVNVEEHVCVEKVRTALRGTVRAADLKVYEFNIVTCTERQYILEDGA